MIIFFHLMYHIKIYRGQMRTRPVLHEAKTYEAEVEATKFGLESILVPRT